MAFLYVFIKLHVILFNEVLNNKFPKTNPAVPSSLLAPESWCHSHWISTPLVIYNPKTVYTSMFICALFKMGNYGFKARCKQSRELFSSIYVKARL